MIPMLTNHTRNTSTGSPVEGDDLDLNHLLGGASEKDAACAAVPSFEAPEPEHLPSWRDLTRLEPGLHSIEATVQARAKAAQGQARFCANTTWSQHYDAWLDCLVGWNARSRDP